MSIQRTVAVGAAMSALGMLWSGSVLALGQNQAIGARVYVGGATAQNGGILRVVRMVCQDNSLANAATRMDRYTGNNNDVFTCLSDAELAPTVTAGTAIAIYKTSVGGSGTGVIPLARNVTTYVSGGTTVNVVFYPNDLTATPLTCTGTPANVVSETISGVVFAGYVNNTVCGDGTQVRAPQVGVSDVEPDKTDGINIPAGEPGRLTTVAVNHGTFGWAVSENLRNALQGAQGLVASSVTRGDASRETYANMPTLTRSQIAAIASGNIINWNSITATATDAAGGTAGQGLFDWVTANTNDANIPNPETVVNGGEGGARTFVIRRFPSSGTQAITEIYTLDERCASGMAGFLPDLDGAAGGDNDQPSFNSDLWVNEYSGSRGVRNGLDRAAGPWSLQTGSPAVHRWGIGLLSLENNNVSTADGNRAYRFIRIDGHAPRLVDVVNGDYTFYAEQVTNISNGAAGAVPPPPAGLPTAFYNFLNTNLGNPVVLAALNAPFNYPWGQSGLMGIPDPDVPRLPAAAPRTNATVQATPVNSSWKSASGSTNNCQDPVIRGSVGAFTTPVGSNADQL